MHSFATKTVRHRRLLGAGLIAVATLAGSTAICQAQGLGTSGYGQSMPAPASGFQPPACSCLVRPSVLRLRRRGLITLFKSARPSRSGRKKADSSRMSSLPGPALFRSKSIKTIRASPGSRVSMSASRSSP